MRTTVDIPDHLLSEAKQLAAERHLIAGRDELLEKGIEVVSHP
jgi:hypothetical protein